MAGKDISEKTLESYDDVFADIVNVLLFDGKEIIKPTELEDQLPRSTYKSDGKLREMERDVAKRWKNGSVRIACIGMENQTAVDKYIPLRVIGYDGAEYRTQYDLNGYKYPVITFILYFGTEQKWSEEISLKNCLEIPAELEEYVNDYRVRVFPIAFLSPEKVKQFKSDFRIVADYFVQMRSTHNYVPNEQTITHVQETLQLLSVMGNDERFEEAYNEGKEGGLKNMSEVLDRIENKGVNKGVSIGVNIGVDLMAKLMSILLKEKKYSDAERASQDAAYRMQLMQQYGLK